MKKLSIFPKNTDEQRAAREREEDSHKLTRAELESRVNEIRRELEAAKRRYDGALFDNYTDGMPPSLDVARENREPYGAVYYLAPIVEQTVNKLQENDEISDDLFGLYINSTQTAYAVGMLAGAIYADCPTAIIDRFERGMTAALAASHWITKQEERP